MTLPTILFIARAVANQTIAPVAVPRLPDIFNSTFGGFNQTNNTNPNWTSTVYNILSVYSDQMGPPAFLLIALIPFGMMWISNGNMKMAGVVGLFVGGFVLAFLPASYQAGAILCIVISVVTTLWGLFK